MREWHLDPWRGEGRNQQHQDKGRCRGIDLCLDVVDSVLPRAMDRDAIRALKGLRNIPRVKLFISTSLCMFARICLIDSTNTGEKQYACGMNKVCYPSRHIIILSPALFHKNDFVARNHVVFINISE